MVELVGVVYTGVTGTDILHQHELIRATHCSDSAFRGGKLASRVAYRAAFLTLPIPACVLCSKSVEGHLDRLESGRSQVPDLTETFRRMFITRDA